MLPTKCAAGWLHSMQSHGMEFAPPLCTYHPHPTPAPFILLSGTLVVILHSPGPCLPPLVTMLLCVSLGFTAVGISPEQHCYVPDSL